MNVDEIKNAICRVIQMHQQAFLLIGSSQTKLLELGAVTGVAEHYRSRDYSVRIINPQGEHSFRVKIGSRGFPWNYSRILVQKGDVSAEIHMNLSVRSAYDPGIYCVDVGITETNSVPDRKPQNTWTCLENAALITFAEAKKLTIYPMLLAQFIGIVHEIKPAFLNGRPNIDEDHPAPILISLGHFSGNSRAIASDYARRNICILVAENYDIRLFKVRQNQIRSPFEALSAD